MQTTTQATNTEELEAANVNTCESEKGIETMQLSQATQQRLRRLADKILKLELFLIILTLTIGICGLVLATISRDYYDVDFAYSLFTKMLVIVFVVQFVRVLLINAGG